MYYKRLTQSTHRHRAGMSHDCTALTLSTITMYHCQGFHPLKFFIGKDALQGGLREIVICDVEKR